MGFWGCYRCQGYEPPPPSLRVILVGKKSSWPTGVTGWSKGEPAYTCSHPQFTPWGQAHWAGWGCCQTARAERHCQVSLTAVAPLPVGSCHCQEAGSASLQCQRPTGCSPAAALNSLRQCQHQLASGEASVSEASVLCQLNCDFHLFDSQGLAAAASCCVRWCKFSACCAWPRSEGSETCPWCWPTLCLPRWWPWPWPWPRRVHWLSPWSRWPSPWCRWPWWWPWWHSLPVSTSWGAASPLACASVFGVHSCRVSVVYGGGKRS